MPNGDPAPSRYLAEWYTPHSLVRPISEIAQRLRESTATLPTEPGRPELLYALEIPQEAYAFGVFAADSSEAVTNACRDAGVPADRVTEAVEGT